MKLTKKQLTQLTQDHLAYNKRARKNRLPILSFDLYLKWVFGSRYKIKQDVKERTFGPPSWASIPDIPSLIGTTQKVHARKSMVERVVQGLETGEVAEEILRKAGRIGLTTSKGGYSYITEETSPLTLGKKTQQL